MRYLLHHLLQVSTDRGPEREALVEGGSRLSYADFLRRSASLSVGLRELGIRRGDRVGVFLQPSVSLPVSIMGISQADAVFVPVHHGQFPEQVAHVLRDCGAVGLITDSGRFKQLTPVLSTVPELSLALIDGTQLEPDEVSSVRCHDFDSLCREALGDENLGRCGRLEKAIGKDLAAILYTSGSTGKPKGVMLSHTNLLAGAEIVSDYLTLTEEDRILAALPMSFDAGLNQLTTSVLQGAVAVLINFHFGRDIVRALQTERITGLAGVPSLWNLLTQPSSGLTAERATHLRYVSNTGGALPKIVLDRLRNLLPSTSVFLMYGLTEAFRSTYLPPSELDRRPGSMGKAIPNTELFVLNQQGQLCKPGEVGELVHHGPTVSMGYWADPEATNRVLRPHPFSQASRLAGERVCYSGDLVKTDADGYLYFVGRRDNQIKSAGFRISPTEVEEVLCRTPGIIEAAVVGAPDEVLGQHLVAFVVTENEATLEAADIISMCAAYLPRHMLPKQIEFVTRLPLTATGKVDYPALVTQLEHQDTP